jgi:hypothetical protein
MANIPDVSAIIDQIRARITHVEEQLRQHQNLSDELERLRGALARLEGEVRSRVNAGRRGRRPASAPESTRPPASTAASTRAVARKGTAKPKSAAGRAPRGENKAKILAALRDGPMTASEISKQTGIGTGSASTMLTKMAKAGEIVKAQRGYALPQ